MGRDGPVHHVVNCRRTTAFVAASLSAIEVSLTLDVVHLARIAMYDEVASGEGAVPDSFVSDVERDLVGVECAGESAVPMKCREGNGLAFVCYCMYHVSLDG